MPTPRLIRIDTAAEATAAGLTPERVVDGYDPEAFGTNTSAARRHAFIRECDRRRAFSLRLETPVSGFRILPNVLRRLGGIWDSIYAVWLMPRPAALVHGQNLVALYNSLGEGGVAMFQAWEQRGFVGAPPEYRPALEVRGPALTAPAGARVIYGAVLSGAGNGATLVEATAVPGAGDVVTARGLRAISEARARFQASSAAQQGQVEAGTSCVCGREAGGIRFDGDDYVCDRCRAGGARRRSA